jgi:3-dehydro-L-gulonate 2-dehydrogenase
MPDTITIPASGMHSEFLRVLLAHGFAADRAEILAQIFTQNSVDGVLTHGVNRFARFIRFLAPGWVVADAEPALVAAAGGIEQWDGRRGPGPLNALHATHRAVGLACGHGIGCAALANTNHWMRAGYYGWEAARAGCALIAWTNTNSNLPAWGAVECRLGNNPIVFAVPHGESAIVLDMAVSQFSNGRLAVQARNGEPLPVPGGFDAGGRLTTDAAAIRDTRRPLPMGYWKGSGLSLLLDILAAVLSGGLATHEISQLDDEYSVSQIYIALDLTRFPHSHAIPRTIGQIVEDYKRATPAESGGEIMYPGERVLRTRARHLADGIAVEPQIWNEILAL